MIRIKESDFYKPIKEYFEKTVAKDYSAQLIIEETHGTISQDIRNLYPSIQNVANYYNYRPDLVVINKSDNNSLWIIEVKDDPLKISDLYQVKRYTEITKANLAFLLSPFHFSREDEQFIQNVETQDIKKFYRMEKHGLKATSIIIGKIDYRTVENKILIDNIYFDEDLNHE